MGRICYTYQVCLAGFSNYLKLPMQMICLKATEYGFIIIIFNLITFYFSWRLYNIASAHTCNMNPYRKITFPIPDPPPRPPMPSWSSQIFKPQGSYRT